MTQSESLPTDYPQPHAQPVDRAIVIGIDNYPEPLGAGEPSAARDAADVASWLTDGNGGGLPEENLVYLVDTQANHNEINIAFSALLQAAQREATRRLWIYVAGVGVSGSSGPLLLTSEGSVESLKVLDPQAYAEFFRTSGLCEEVVLVVDCAPVDPSLEWPIFMDPRPPPFTLPETKAPEAAHLYMWAPLDTPPVGKTR